ncbi:MAG: phosphate ABC transporter permease PtsA, partial [Syntrophobacteraceae bacterium]
MISLHTRRHLTNVLSQIGAMLTVCFGLFWLGWILLTLLEYGIPGLSLSVFTRMTPPPGSQGGLLNAIAGSFSMVMLSTLIATPIGILA